MYSFNQIKKFKKYLIKELHLKTKVKLRLLKHCKLLVMADNSLAYGAYNHTIKTILMPLNQGKWDFYGTLAHEYVHVWQNENHLEPSEEEADIKACELCTKFFNVKFGIVKCK